MHVISSLRSAKVGAVIAPLSPKAASKSVSDSFIDVDSLFSSCIGPLSNPSRIVFPRFHPRSLIVVCFAFLPLIRSSLSYLFSPRMDMGMREEKRRGPDDLRLMTGVLIPNLRPSGCGDRIRGHVVQNRGLGRTIWRLYGGKWATNWCTRARCNKRGRNGVSNRADRESDPRKTSLTLTFLA